MSRIRDPLATEVLANLCHCSSGSFDFLETEATAGIEPAMKVLQTSALPLGYVADE